jgi:hypothetical protein
MPGELHHCWGRQLLSNLAIVDCPDQGQFIGFLSLK